MVHELYQYHEKCEDLKMNIGRFKGEIDKSKNHYFQRKKYELIYNKPHPDTLIQQQDML